MYRPIYIVQMHKNVAFIHLCIYTFLPCDIQRHFYSNTDWVLSQLVIDMYVYLM